MTWYFEACPRWAFSDPLAVEPSALPRAWSSSVVVSDSCWCGQPWSSSVVWPRSIVTRPSAWTPTPLPSGAEQSRPPGANVHVTETDVPGHGRTGSGPAVSGGPWGRSSPGAGAGAGSAQSVLPEIRQTMRLVWEAIASAVPEAKQRGDDQRDEQQHADELGAGLASFSTRAGHGTRRSYGGRRRRT